MIRRILCKGRIYPKSSIELTTCRIFQSVSIMIIDQSDSCRDMVKSKPPIIWRIDSKHLILRIKNIAYIQLREFFDNFLNIKIIIGGGYLCNHHHLIQNPRKKSSTPSSIHFTIDLTKFWINRHGINRGLMMVNPNYKLSSLNEIKDTISISLI